MDHKAGKGRSRLLLPSMTGQASDIAPHAPHWTTSGATFVGSHLIDMRIARDLLLRPNNTIGRKDKNGGHTWNHV